MGESSIWRWAVTDNLVQRFAALTAADDARFAEIATEMSQEGESAAPDIDEIERDTEARLRAMDLPPEIMETMLKGFRTTMQEARTAREAESQEDDDAHGPDAEGPLSVALASSHIFRDGPHARLDPADIDQHVRELEGSYRSAISKALADGGQPFSAYLGLRGWLWQGDVFDALKLVGLDAVTWVWVTPQTVFFLSRWQEDRDMPIDLEFGRAPRRVFEAARARVGSLR